MAELRGHRNDFRGVWAHHTLCAHSISFSSGLYVNGVAHKSRVLLDGHFGRLIDHVVIVIPKPDHGPGQIVFITERAQARRTQQKIPASDTRSQPQPAGGQHANKVSAGKEQYIARDPPDTLNDAVGPLADLFRRFAPRAAVAKQIPVVGSLEGFRPRSVLRICRSPIPPGRDR